MPQASGGEEAGPAPRTLLVQLDGRGHRLQPGRQASLVDQPRPEARLHVAGRVDAEALERKLRRQPASKP